MPTNTFTILGSSSGMPQADRATAGYLLKTGESLSLIDCGGGIASSFLKRGFDPLMLDRIFISHTHPDHVCELPLVIQMVYLAGKTSKLDIYLPEEFVAPFAAFMPAVYLIREKLPFAIDLIGYRGGFVFDDAYRLTAIANNHLLGYADYVDKLGLPNRLQCHSFRIEVGEKSLFYSADIRDLDDIKPHLDGLDYAVIESTHIELEPFFEFAQQIKVGKYILTHLGGKDEVVKINEMARKYGLSNIVTAIDGLEINL
jgi:ribonuclease BN (tRNA processing enzyme)